MKKRFIDSFLENIVLQLFVVITFAILINVVYWHYCGEAERRSICEEIKREKESMEKCGRPGTSDMFPALRPCDYEEATKGVKP